MSKLFTSPLALLVLIGLLIYGGFRVFQVWEVYRELELRAARLEERVSSTEALNQELRAELQIAKTPEAVERDAKARLNLKKPGEEVVIVIPAVAGTTSAAGPPPGLFARFAALIRALFRR